MEDKQIEGFRSKLLEEKARLLQQIESLEDNGLGVSLAESIGELSVYDNHPADIGGELFDRSKDIALRDNARVLLSEIETSLAKIDNHTYGICEKCGRDISPERLEAQIWATECIDCQRQDDAAVGSRRPLEEAVLTPPFSRNFLDHNQREYMGYDGEDALQDVLRYGSSDSPQDLPGTHDYQDLYPNSQEHPGIVERVESIPDPQSEL